jgi:hypothetical protein
MSDARTTVRYSYIGGDPRYRVGDDGSTWTRAARGKGCRDRIINPHWRPLAQHANASGYMVVRIPGRSLCQVHRLVLEAFVGPCPAGMVCRHLDGNPANNRPENLCWGTVAENVADQFRHGTFIMGERHHNAKLTEQKARQVVEQAEAGKCLAEIAAPLGMSASAVCSVIHGQTWRQATGKEPEYPGQSRGERHHWAKLTADDIRQIRAMLADGCSRRETATKFHISETHLSQIARRLTWSHI